MGAAATTAHVAPSVLTRGPAAPITPGAAAARRAVTAAATAAPRSTWQVSYTGAPSDQAKAAVQAAVNTWAGLLTSSVPIKLAVTFAPTDPGVLGYTGASEYYSGPGIGDGVSYYPSAEADALAGSDVSVAAGGSPDDIGMTLSSSETGLYYGTDGNPGTGQIDVETVVLHELAHGLGFVGSMEVAADGTGSRWDPPIVYDRFTAAGGSSLLAPTNGTAALGAALTGGAVTWTGRQAVAANGGQPVRLYAPSPWEGGSSYSHLDEATYPRGGPDSLMTPQLGPGEVIASPGPLVLAMLSDMGWQTAAAAPATPTPIAARYASDAAARALLGSPVGTEQVSGAVHWQVYQRGRMYSSPAAGVHLVYGALLATYLQTGDWQRNGLPLTDEQGTADGAARFNDFENVSLYWRGSTGTYALLGAVRSAWRASGGEAGPLGYPVTGETGTPDGVARWNDFSRAGSVYWTPATGAHVVYGGIRAKWLAGGGYAALGAPVTDESDAPGGGRYNDFSGAASVYWSPSAGSHLVYGGIRAAWLAGGGAARLGMPVTDETTAADGAGRFNDFAGGASAYWSPSTGAHLVYGGIRERWLAAGGVKGPGYPVSDEADAAGGGRFNDFSRSASVYWSSGTGAHVVLGAIRDRWAAVGGAGGGLGLPSSEEYDWSGGRRSDFAHGWVAWSPATGAVDHRS